MSKKLFTESRSSIDSISQTSSTPIMEWAKLNNLCEEYLLSKTNSDNLSNRSLDTDKLVSEIVKNNTSILESKN